MPSGMRSAHYGRCCPLIPENRNFHEGTEHRTEYYGDCVGQRESWGSKHSWSLTLLLLFTNAENQPVRPGGKPLDKGYDYYWFKIVIETFSCWRQPLMSVTVCWLHYVNWGLAEELNAMRSRWGFKPLIFPPFECSLMLRMACRYDCWERKSTLT